MTIKEFFSFKKNIFFWGNLLAMLAVVIASVVGVFYWLDSYTRHDISVSVPDVEGMQMDEACALLEKRALKGVITDSVYNTKQPGGIVLDMNPAKGAVVKEGRMVYLTVNTTRPPMRQLPALIDNSSLREAEAKLKAMGFKLEPNDTVAGERDWIYGVKYNGTSLQNGDNIPVGAVLTLEVGCGEEMPEENDSLTVGQTPVGDAAVDDSWFE